MNLYHTGFGKKLAKDSLKKTGLFIVLLLGGCQATQPASHHVLIAYPEHWNDRDRRPCFLGREGGSTVSREFGQPDLPQLDCDRFVKGELIHRTPPDRIFALDVFFDGDYTAALGGKGGGAVGETPWTCQRIGDTITCKP